MNRKSFIKNASAIGGFFALDRTSTVAKMLSTDLHPSTQIIKQELKIDKAYSTMRLAPYPWLGEKQFDETLDLLIKYKGVAEEIAFFTGVSGSGVPLDVFKVNMNILKKRMVKAREKGFNPGLNLFVTLGHRDENLENSLKGNYTHMTAIDGTISKGCYCPNDEAYQLYLHDKYKVASETNPDFIWIDDDARMSNHGPVKYACFCKNCLKIFAEETGIKYTCESLRKAMNSGKIEEKLEIRNAWLQHNRNTMGRLCALIEKSIHGVNPNIAIGCMSGEAFYDGYDFDNYAKLLRGQNQTLVMWRPGGGYYVDTYTEGLAEKSHAVGRQVSILPESVFCIQSEIEDIPCQRLGKAASIVVLEAASHIAAGCTGTTYSILPYYDEPLEGYESLFAALQHARPFFDLMAKTLGRSKITGVQAFWNKNSFVSGNITSGDWFSSSVGIGAHELYDIGLPACYSNNHANITIFQKDNIFVLSKEEIKEILSRPIYMDGEALQQLNMMGYQDLTGFEILASNGGDCLEKYLNHPLNGKYEKRERRGYPRQTAYAFKKTDEKAEALSILYDLSNREMGVAMGIFENKLGGRICVAGHYPFNLMGNPSKSWQMKSVFRWLSQDNLAGYIASFHKINLWIREPQDGNIALAFTNSFFDPAKDVILMLKTDKARLKLYDMDCNVTTISSSGSDGPYQKFVIPYVNPWQIRLLVTE